MSKIFNPVAVVLGAATVAALSLGLATTASQAAKPIIKNYCERVCVDGGDCFYSCSYDKPPRLKYKPPSTHPTHQPEPIPRQTDWRDTVLYTAGGSGGGGGGGGGGSR